MKVSFVGSYVRKRGAEKIRLPFTVRITREEDIKNEEIESFLIKVYRRSKERTGIFFHNQESVIAMAGADLFHRYGRYRLTRGTLSTIRQSMADHADHYEPLWTALQVRKEWL